MIQDIGQEMCKRLGKRLVKELGQGAGSGAEGLDGVLGQHEAIPWKGHGAGHGAGQKGLKDLTGRLDSIRRLRGTGMELAMELDKELDKRLGQRLGKELSMELAMELGNELGKRLGKIIGHAAVRATHILNMCTMLEKVKQHNKIHQATIAMLSQISLNEGRLLQILAGLPQNQPADDPGHWPGDHEAISWEGHKASHGAGQKARLGIRQGARRGAWPGAEELDWALGQHEAILLGGGGGGGGGGHGAVGPGHRAIPWEGHGAGQKARPGVGQRAGHGARHGAGQEAGRGVGVNQIFDVILAAQLPDLLEPEMCKRLGKRLGLGLDKELGQGLKDLTGHLDSMWRFRARAWSWTRG
ncbi:hypothetical protein FEM48_Zijuj04G0138300 [Ziziphus jujuba var. spinosa]|uniref:Uncharacterized protein n=1 Tax=Ziziphus jujuba var. spinosa TaxID=714518 RepID=A0A978VK88_ZIZJJ|nr:hypothetical protein FEM48_Zijuj04G0138300 [Ziziphus jujuba var. spinosa]